MSTDVSRIDDVVTGGPNPFERVVIPHTRSAGTLLENPEILHRHIRALHVDSAQARREALLRSLEERQYRFASQSGLELLEALSDAGFAWRDIARLAHVSVPAVQKWRRGEGITGANRLRLAKIVALLDVLDEHLIAQPASWLEMPVKEGVALSRLTLLAEGRYELVLELISDEQDFVSVDAVLDEYDPEWRNKFIDDRFEAFTAADGIVSIRPRS